RPPLRAPRSACGGRTRHVPVPAPPGRAPLRVESGTETRPVRRRSSARRRDPETSAQEHELAEFIYTMHKARKAVGDKVSLDEVSMSLCPGAKLGMAGPNGAGKSTILKIMAGLDQPSNGEARLSPGYSVGILLQEPPLDESKTVLENVQEGMGELFKKVQRFNAIGEEMAEPD